MKVDEFTRDHKVVVQAAFAYRSDQPLYAEQLLGTCEDPMSSALELLALLIAERAERQQQP